MRGNNNSDGVKILNEIILQALEETTKDRRNQRTAISGVFQKGPRGKARNLPRVEESRKIRISMATHGQSLNEDGCPICGQQDGVGHILETC